MISVQSRLSVRRSCYETLIRIGDLSRYRSTELAENKREPARSCYVQATRVFPNVGTAWNSLAVLNKQQDDHFSAIYYVYRSLVVDEPFPDGSGNLDLGFKAIRRKHDSRRGSYELKDIFTAVHASCYDGQAFENYGNLQATFLSLLEHHLAVPPETSTMITIEKICLTNMAALYYVENREAGKY